MRKYPFILLLCILLPAGCVKDGPEDWQGYSSTPVELGDSAWVDTDYTRLVILNEGLFPTYSTIDILDFSTNRYYTDLFTKANPLAPWNLGLEATEMAFIYGQLWVLLYTSCQIAVIELPSFRIIEYMPVDYPRHMVVDGSYVYVTSYGTSISGEVSAVGKVYRINAATRKTDYVYSGLQPEGLAVLGEKLYVADSGHLSWPHRKYVSIINLKTFKEEMKEIDLPARHPNQVISRGGVLWVNTYGDTEWRSVEDMEEPPMTEPHTLIRMGVGGNGRIINGVHAEKMVLYKDKLYIYGNAAEMEGGTEWHFYRVDADGDKVEDIPFAGTGLEILQHPNAITVNPDNGDIFICDMEEDGDSRLYCFSPSLEFKWSIPTGYRTNQVLFW